MIATKKILSVLFLLSLASLGKCQQEDTQCAETQKREGLLAYIKEPCPDDCKDDVFKGIRAVQAWSMKTYIAHNTTGLNDLSLDAYKEHLKKIIREHDALQKYDKDSLIEQIDQLNHAYLEKVRKEHIAQNANNYEKLLDHLAHITRLLIKQGHKELTIYLQEQLKLTNKTQPHKGRNAQY